MPTSRTSGIILEQQAIAPRIRDVNSILTEGYPSLYKLFELFPMKQLDKLKEEIKMQIFLDSNIRNNILRKELSIVINKAIVKIVVVKYSHYI